MILKKKIVAVLHDVVEDTKMTIGELAQLFPDHLVMAIKILTKKKGEEYFDYIKRLIESNNEIAIAVKIADLKDNLDLNRIKNPTEQDWAQPTLRNRRRYIQALDLLQKATAQRL